MPLIYIKICDEGWVIEKMASRIAENLEHVVIGLDDRDDADLVYFFPYLTFERHIAPREMGFFTHIEADDERKANFFRVAQSVGCCTSQSEHYAKILRNHHAKDVHVISPGVDLEIFKPKIRIGVVGRTYDSGRKGEQLVRQMLDIEEIEWKFTGKGWPLPSLPVSDLQMPDFYNSIDYLLVPSLIEGGPLCVLEALACGKEVIAPSVGWVPEFPHIPYTTGDAESLRTVLNTLIAKRVHLREHVVNRTWANWIAKHDALFQSQLTSLSEK